MPWRSGTLWHATYWLSGAVKIITALSSVPTAILLIHLVPQALELPSPKALRLEIAERTSTQEALLAEIAQRTQAQEKLRRSEEELHSLAGRLITVQEDERKRIARDLHDDFSQRLALHCVDLDLQRHSLPVGSDMARELERLRSDAEKLTLEVRQIAHDLHHPQLALGLRHGAASFCREFSEQHGIAVPLSGRCKAELIRWRDLIGPGFFAYVFPNLRVPTRPLKDVRRSWAKALKDAKTDYFWIYNLRHTFASRLSAAGLADLFVAQMMGHSTPSILQTYAKVIDEYRRDAIRKLENLRVAHTTKQQDSASPTIN